MSDTDTRTKIFFINFFFCLQLSHCDWLKPRPRVHKGKLHPPQTHLFERFIYWLMNSVLISTIKASMSDIIHSLYYIIAQFIFQVLHNVDKKFAINFTLVNMRKQAVMLCFLNCSLFSVTGHLPKRVMFSCCQLHTCLA